jgi:hypothetical protein
LSSEITPRVKPVKTTGLHVGEPAPGVKKVDPILVADNVKRTFGGLTAVDVDGVWTDETLACAHPTGWHYDYEWDETDAPMPAGRKGDPIEFACMIAFARPPTSEEHAALSEHLEAYGPASLARVIFNLNAFVYVD